MRPRCLFLIAILSLIAFPSVRSDGGVDCRRVHKSLTTSGNSPETEHSGGEASSPTVAAPAASASAAAGELVQNSENEPKIKKDVDMAEPPISSQTPVSSARGS